MIIIITTDTDNFKSNAFNRFLEKMPEPFKLVFAKEDMNTTYHKVIGAVCTDDVEEDYMGLTD